MLCIILRGFVWISGRLSMPLCKHSIPKSACALLLSTTLRRIVAFVLCQMLNSYNEHHLRDIEVLIGDTCEGLTSPLDSPSSWGDSIKAGGGGSSDEAPAAALAHALGPQSTTLPLEISEEAESKTGEAAAAEAAGSLS